MVQYLIPGRLGSVSAIWRAKFLRAAVADSTAFWHPAAQPGNGSTRYLDLDLVELIAPAFPTLARFYPCGPSIPKPVSSAEFVCNVYNDLSFGRIAQARLETCGVVSSGRRALLGPALGLSKGSRA